MTAQQDTLRETLTTHFGLSTYEAAAYVSLVRNGKQTMSEIASTSEVPRQRVYDVTESLRDAGLIEIIDEAPKTAYAIAPADAFGSVQNQIDTTLRELEEMHQTDPSVETGIAMFKNRATIEKYIRQVIESADVTVSYVIPFELLKRYGAVLRDVTDSVNSKLIISNVPEHFPREDPRDAMSIEGLAREVKAVKTQEPLAICADHSVGFFWVEYSETQSRRESRGFYITSSQLALLLDRFITELLWSNASRVAGPHTQVELPLRFLRIRDCIDAIERLTTDRGRESLAVEIEGYDTATHREVSITGDLIDYHRSSDEGRAYLVLDLEDGGMTGQSTIATVGGYNSTLEDYEAREITLQEPEAAA